MNLKQIAPALRALAAEVEAAPLTKGGAINTGYTYRAIRRAQKALAAAGMSRELAVRVVNRACGEFRARRLAGA